VRPRRAADEALEELRARIASIDRSLILSLCAREDTQGEILALKRALSLPLVDGEQERDVRQRAREWALEIGSDPELAAQVVAAALESGKRRFLRVGGSSGHGGRAVVVLLQPPSRSEGPKHRTAAVAPGTSG
jgi:chorismate mutase